MKNIILLLVCTFSGVITLMLIMTMYGRINRSMELKSNLSSVVEETLGNVMVNEKYGVRNTTEMVADVVEAFVYTIDAKSDAQIDIFQCDKERGIISVLVTFLYKHPNGKQGSIEAERTVIYNRTNIEEPLEKYKVQFLVGEECYKIYEVCANCMISPPIEPKVDGKTFVGWTNSDGASADFTNPIGEDVIYYADMQ